MVEVKYTGEALWNRMERAVEKVNERLRKTVTILEQAKVTCQFDIDSICDPSSADSIAFDREHDEYIVARAMKIIEHEFEPSTWAAFRMQIVDRQRPADVAAYLGLSTNAVVKSKSRVLKRLREYVAFFNE